MTEGDAGPSGEPKGDDRVGSILAGRYRILSRLGEGAMGAVYLGEHLKIGRRDALKVLRPSLARDEEAIARFTRGARNASGIRHRNVCAIYDFGTTEDGLHFLAMEYVDGGNLTDLLTEGGALPVPRAVSILLQAASALQVAHDRGIIHRDLKPDNIMLARESDGRDLVKVVDFDISLGPPDGEGARVTRHGYVVGTPEYMSPEQLTGDPLKPTSDVYSLALVFFRMLTGRLPFDGGTAQEVMVNRLTVDPLALADAAPELELPHALEGVLRTALERRAEDRFQSAADFAAAVREATGMPAEGGGGSWGGAVGGGQSSGGAASGGAHGAGAGSGAGVAAGAGPGSGAGSGAAAGARGGRTSGSTGAGAGSDSIPRTRVSSSGDSRSDGFDSGSGGVAGTDPRRKMVWIGGGAALGLILLVGLAITVLPGSRDQTGDLLTDPPPAGMDPANPGEGDDDDPTDPGSDATDPPSTTDDPPVNTDPADNRTTTDPPPRDPVSNDPPATDPTPTDDPDVLPFPSGRPDIELPDGEPTQILGRLLVAGTDEPGGIPRPVLSAVRDTAYVVWSDAALSRPDSALAAYLIGSAMVPLGDSLPGIRWLEEAVRLDRLQGYVNELERYRDGGGR